MAIGAALDVIGDNEERLHFTYKPEFPLIYLTNQSELGKIHAYIESKYARCLVAELVRRERVYRQ